jgi:diaminohydroxyphosphoribosylaminopyrimidine deaminase / 5-amino-6-(5-phosphoribosylamino)uracil reductase
MSQAFNSENRTDPAALPDPSDFDRQIMRRCLELASTARGRTAPNPMVGAVVVQAGQIVGEGFHSQAGQPHAEVFALRAAGDRAAGATIYVNLEPCSHYGRTPPCADALIQAGVAKVVVGMVDPNPQVAGRGIEKLRLAGLDVTVGVEAAACQKLNEGFLYRMRHQQPFGILKYAMTLDGKIAATTGHSTWITSPTARSWVHDLRSGCDAVIVGGNTVRRDNPLLTSHGQGHDPLRVVMSQTLNLPAQAQLWQTTQVPTLVLTSPQADPTQQKLLEQQGVEVVVTADLSPRFAMQHLYERGCLSVLWESGGRLSASAVASGAVQKIFAFIAPKLIGGQTAPSPLGDLGFTEMTQALRLERVQWQAIGPDLLVEGYLPEPP